MSKIIVLQTTEMGLTTEDQQKLRTQRGKLRKQGTTKSNNKVKNRDKYYKQDTGHRITISSS